MAVVFIVVLDVVVFLVLVLVYVAAVDPRNLPWLKSGQEQLIY